MKSKVLLSLFFVGLSYSANFEAPSFSLPKGINFGQLKSVLSKLPKVNNVNLPAEMIANLHRLSALKIPTTQLSANIEGIGMLTAHNVPAEKMAHLMQTGQNLNALGSKIKGMTDSAVQNFLKNLDTQSHEYCVLIKRTTDSHKDNKKGKPNFANIPLIEGFVNYRTEAFNCDQRTANNKGKDWYYVTAETSKNDALKQAFADKDGNNDDGGNSKYDKFYQKLIADIAQGLMNTQTVQDAITKYGTAEKQLQIDQDVILTAHAGQSKLKSNLIKLNKKALSAFQATQVYWNLRSEIYAFLVAQEYANNMWGLGAAIEKKLSFDKYFNAPSLMKKIKESPTAKLNSDALKQIYKKFSTSTYDVKSGTWSFAASDWVFTPVTPFKDLFVPISDIASAYRTPTDEDGLSKVIQPIFDYIYRTNPIAFPAGVKFTYTPPSNKANLIDASLPPLFGKMILNTKTNKPQLVVISNFKKDAGKQYTLDIPDSLPSKTIMFEAGKGLSFN